MLDIEFEHKGYFWLPQKPDLQLAGILKFTQIDGITLELFGSFNDYVNPFKKETNIILGFISNGKKVTLLNCFEHSRKFNAPGFELSSVSAINLFIGNHFEVAHEICFSELRVSYEGINYWLDISGFDSPTYNDGAKEMTLRYKRPESIIFEIKEEWTLNVEFSFYGPLNYSRPLEKVEIKQLPEVVFKPTKSKDFSEFQEKFQVFNSLLSICYFSFPKVQVVEFYILDELDSDRYKKVEWYYKHGLNYERLLKHENNKDFLLTYQRVQKDFAALLKNWYTLYDRLSASINILTENFMDRSYAIEFRFLGLTQALENFHRRTRGGQFSFVTRIQSIVENLPPKIKLALLSVDADFPNLIRLNRNFLTHYNEELEPKAVPLKELFVLSEKMKIILITVLLKETGILDTELEKIIISQGAFLFNHIIRYENVKEYFKDWE